MPLRCPQNYLQFIHSLPLIESVWALIGFTSPQPHTYSQFKFPIHVPVPCCAFPASLQFCRKVWLGLYDSRSHMEPDSKDETKVRDFMCQKYEKKRWYVAPTEAMYEEARKLNTPEKKEPATKPLRALGGDSVPGLRLNNQVSSVVALSINVLPPGQNRVVCPETISRYWLQNYSIEAAPGNC